MTDSTHNPTERRARRMHGRSLIMGAIVGILITLVLVVLIGMPFAIGHRQDLPLERLYGDLAVGIAARTQADSTQNPAAQNPRAVEMGRLAYTGSCAVCHGVNGDGKGMFGGELYPPATDLQGHDTQEKSDAQLFWIVKNGLSFLGMPAFKDQYSDQQIWALVAYMRSLGNDSTRQSGIVVPTPTTDQLAMADPNGDAAQRGAAIYFAQGCVMCHGAVGNAPGELHLRGGHEAQEAVRRGRPGMPAFPQTQITDAQLTDLIVYLDTFRGGRG
jgi:mono/diheme cytochrome c family protein